MIVPATDLVPCYSRVPLPGARTIAFGRTAADALAIPVRQLGPEPWFESWALEDNVRFGAITIERAERLEDAARDVYARVIQEVRAAGYPYLLRMWNFVGGINDADDGRERYQLFCAGRHDAFMAAGYLHGADLPAASAVGMPGRGLITYYLAAREPGVQVENPRQIAAYHYPRQYGPKSPSFSRATVWNGTVFVSGTASVVGHRTAHPGDVGAQLIETLGNLEAVLRQTGRSLASVVAAKTYVRHARDYPLIAELLADVFPANLYLEADICRSDLALEIEVVAT